MGSAKYQNDGDPRTSGPGFGVTFHEDGLTEPLRWRKLRRVFVNSMSDLAHARVSDTAIGRVFAVMAAARRHTFQVLTKRPRRLAGLLSSTAFRDAVQRRIDEKACDGSCPPQAEVREPLLRRQRPWLPLSEWPLANVWMGTSIESDGYCWRADELRRTPAAVRFLSLEPLLGLLPSLDLTGIDWVIVGGESGPRFRPLELDWVREIRDRCRAGGVALFFKRVGGASPKAGGRLLDGRTWDEFPVVADGASVADRCLEHDHDAERSTGSRPATRHR